MEISTKKCNLKEMFLKILSLKKKATLKLYIENQTEACMLCYSRWFYGSWKSDSRVTLKVLITGPPSNWSSA